MPRITFGSESTELMLDPFDMSVNEKGLVVNDRTGEKVTDPFGDTVSIKNVGGIVHLESHGMTVNDEGRVLNADGDPVSTNFDNESYSHTEALVHIRGETAILRSGFANSSDFATAVDVYEKSGEE